MYKFSLGKKKVHNLNLNYSENNYTGFSGFLFSLGHKNLEKNVENKKFTNVLEIGAGTEPQIKYIKHEYSKYTILETSDFAIDYLKESYDNIDIIKYDGLNLPFEDNSFDRIILSHCLEHIENYEQFIDKLMKILKSGGVLSLSQPTDPGILWRVARYVRQVLTLSNSSLIIENNYIMAKEHINSIFNIVSVLRYKYPNKITESYVPFKIRTLDFNLFYNVHIRK